MATEILAIINDHLHQSSQQAGSGTFTWIRSIHSKYQVVIARLLLDPLIGGNLCMFSHNNKAMQFLAIYHTRSYPETVRWCCKTTNFVLININCSDQQNQKKMCLSRHTRAKKKFHYPTRCTPRPSCTTILVITYNFFLSMNIHICRLLSCPHNSRCGSPLGHPLAPSTIYFYIFRSQRMTITANEWYSNHLPLSQSQLALYLLGYTWEGSRPLIRN